MLSVSRFRDEKCRTSFDTLDKENIDIVQCSHTARQTLIEVWKNRKFHVEIIIRFDFVKPQANKRTNANRKMRKHDRRF